MGMFRSWHRRALLLAGNGAVLRSMLKPIGPARAAGYAAAMREPGRLTGALNWYRASGAGAVRQCWAVSRCPTTYVWSDQDPVVGRTAARAAPRPGSRRTTGW